MPVDGVQTLTADPRTPGAFDNLPATKDPFVHPRFIEACAHRWPAEARAVHFEVDAGAAEPVRWGCVERSRAGFRGAAAWARPEFPPGADEALAWSRLLAALAERGNALLRVTDCCTVRLTPADVAAAEAAAAGRRWRVRPGIAATFTADLAPPEEERFLRLNQSHRRYVRKARKAGLTLERVEGDLVDEYLRVQDSTYERQGMTVWPHDYLTRLLATSSHFRAYAATTPEGAAAAVVLMALDRERRTAVYLHGGSGDRRVQGAGQFIHWETACALAREGYRTYDYGGIGLTPEGELENGIDEFKRAFGGTLVKAPAMDVEFAPLKSRLIQGGMNVAQKLVGGLA